MRKKLIYILSLLVCACACTATALAADRVAYVKDGGTGDGSSAESPLGTITAAVTALDGNGGTIVACGDVTISARTTVPEQSGDLTLTSVNGGALVLKQRFQFAKNANGKKITIDLPIRIEASYDIYMFGGFHDFHITEKCTVTNTGYAGMLSFFGGMCGEDGVDNATLITELPYTVTVDAGTYRYFAAGNHRTGISYVLGSIAAPVTVNINGGTFGVAGSYDLETNNKNYYGISLSGATILADDATLNITGGIFNTPIFIQGRYGCVPAGASMSSTLTASDRKYYAADGDIAVNITGGTFKGGLISAYYTLAGYVQMLRGDFDVTIGENAVFTVDTVIDATQVKAYENSNKKATLTYPTGASIMAKRFDVVNGEDQTYTEPIRVAFVGDSITEGYWDSVKDRLTQAYPAQFLGLAEADGKEVIVSNYGISASGFLPSTQRYYMSSLAYPMVTEECDATYYVIAMGTNDANTIGGANGALKKFDANYRALCKLLGDKASTECVYITNSIYRYTSNTTADLRASAILHPTQEKIATELAKAGSGKYAFINLYQLTYAEAKSGELFQGSSENLHPAEHGYGIMAKKLYDAILGTGAKEVENFYMTDIYVSDSGTRNGAGTADDPISNWAVAMDKLEAGKPATVHVIGTITYNSNFVTSLAPSKLTIVGEGTNAKLSLSGNTVKFCSDIKIDNLKLESTCTTSGGTTVFAYYNDVEITDSVETSGTWNFYAGYNVWTDADLASATSTTYDTVVGISDDRDCTVTICGGTWTGFAGGNRRCVAAAPIGTYSGDMTLTVGGSAEIVGTSYIGVVGANYLTGTLTLNMLTTNSVELPDYMTTGTLATGITYDTANNTGRIVRNSVLMGDLDKNGTIDLRDALTMLNCVLNGNFTYGDCYFGRSHVSLTDVVWILTQIVA